MTLASVQWGNGIENAWSSIASFVPKFLAFLAILAIGYIIAKVAFKAINALLERVGFDRAVERGGIRKALSKSQYDASDIVGKLVFYTVMLFTLQAAFGVFGANPISDVINAVVAYLPQVIAAIIIIVVAAAIASAVREMVEASIGGLSYGKTLANAAGVVLLAVGIFAALNQLQIAPQIVTGLFYAILAAAVGVTIVAVGGGGVRPMQQYWENALSKVSEETQNIKQEAAGSKDRIKARAEDRKEQAQGGSDDDVQVDVREQSNQASEPWASGSSSSSGRNPQGF